MPSLRKRREIPSLYIQIATQIDSVTKQQFTIWTARETPNPGAGSAMSGRRQACGIVRLRSRHLCATSAEKSGFETD